MDTILVIMDTKTDNQVKMDWVRSHVDYRKRSRRRLKRYTVRYNFEDVAKICGYSVPGFRKKLKRLEVDTDIYSLSLSELVDFINIHKR